MKQGRCIYGFNPDCDFGILQGNFRTKDGFGEDKTKIGL